MGKQFFNFYLMMYIFIPLVCFLLFGWHDNFWPIEIENMTLSLSILFLSIITVLFASSRQVSFKPLFSMDINNKFFVTCCLLISILFLIFSLILSISYGESFRHSGPDLSEAGMQAILHTTLKGSSVAIFIIYIRAFLLNEKLNPFHRLSSFFISMAFIVFPVAAFDVIYCCVFLFFVLGHAFTSKLLNMKFLLGVILGIPILLGIIFLGISTKIGFENTFDYFSENGFSVLKYLQYRLSVFFFSTLICFSSLESLFIMWSEGLTVTTDMIIYRLELLFGLNPDRLIVSNLNVLNFKNVFVNYDPSMQIGASPGLLLCFLYLSPFPLFLFFLYFFVFGISGIFNSAFGKEKKSYFLVFCLIIAMHGIINNPIHVSTSIGPDLVKLFLILMSLTVRIKHNSNQITR